MLRPMVVIRDLTWIALPSSADEFMMLATPLPSSSALHALSVEVFSDTPAVSFSTTSIACTAEATPTIHGIEVSFLFTTWYEYNLNNSPMAASSSNHAVLARACEWLGLETWSRFVAGIFLVIVFEYECISCTIVPSER